MAGQSDSNLDNAKAAVHLIVTRLETRFNGFNISEIIKGGSLGHGTAVIDNYDIDLVVYSRDISPEEVERRNGFSTWTKPLQEFIEREFKIKSFTPGYNNRSVQFRVQYEGVILEIDLLVSPFWDTPHDFYQFLRSIPKGRRDKFSVSASKWQVEFFRNKESKLKDYIKKAKAWRNQVWHSKRGKNPSSYLLSVLVVKAYENSGYLKGPQEVTRALRVLVQSFPVNVYWENGGIYRLSNYGDLQPSSYQHRIVDPANPANNVWESLEDPDEFIREIASIDLK